MIMNLHTYQNQASKLSDEELVNHFKKRRDPAVINAIYNRYAHLVFGVSLKYLKNKAQAEDMVMLVFEKLLNKLHIYEIRNFKSWLYMLVKNECMMELRKKKYEVSGLPSNEKINGSFVEFYEELHHSGEADEQFIKNLKKEIGNLSEEQKACIILFYFENKSYKEIANETGYKVTKVKSYIQNGKRNLKNNLLRYASFKRS